MGVVSAKRLKNLNEQNSFYCTTLHSHYIDFFFFYIREKTREIENDNVNGSFIREDSSVASCKTNTPKR